jgi:adenine/guanine phosphoribosyltransferase-like PRPP-binding protein
MSKGEHIAPASRVVVVDDLLAVIAAWIPRP